MRTPTAYADFSKRICFHLFVEWYLKEHFYQSKIRQELVPTEFVFQEALNPYLFISLANLRSVLDTITPLPLCMTLRNKDIFFIIQYTPSPNNPPPVNRTSFFFKEIFEIWEIVLIIPPIYRKERLTFCLSGGISPKFTGWQEGASPSQTPNMLTYNPSLQAPSQAFLLHFQGCFRDF